jgi:hypothetical protein
LATYWSHWRWFKIAQWVFSPTRRF